MHAHCASHRLERLLPLYGLEAAPLDDHEVLVWCNLGHFLIVAHLEGQDLREFVRSVRQQTSSFTSEAVESLGHFSGLEVADA